jgi:hypothetical protein
MWGNKFTLDSYIKNYFYFSLLIISGLDISHKVV